MDSKNHISINYNFFSETFPYSFTIDRSLKIVKYGDSFLKKFNGYRELGFQSLFYINEIDELEVDFNSLQSFDKQKLMLESLVHSNFYLNARVFSINKGNELLFVAEPDTQIGNTNRDELFSLEKKQYSHHDFDLESGFKDLYTKVYSQVDKVSVLNKINEFIPASKSGLPKQEEVNEKSISKTINLCSNVHEVILELAMSLINVPVHKFEEKIGEALSNVSTLLKLDRAYIFRFDLDTQTTTNTYEWCAEGIAPQIENLQSIPFGTLEEWVDMHFKGDIVYIPNVDDLDKEGSLYKLLVPQQIKTLITIPLIAEGNCFGFIGFDSVNQMRTWVEVEIFLISMLAQLIANGEVRKQSEQKIIEVRNKAIRANREKSYFLANMSHEARTPINIISGFTDLLLETSLTDEQRSYADTIRTTSEGLLSLVNDLLDFEKIESGKLTFYNEPFSIYNIVEELIYSMQPLVNSKNLKLTVTKNPDLPMLIVGDRLRLKQILYNLISNAIKFTEKGEVKVKIDLLEKDKKNCKIQFSVIDTGIGISEEEKSQIFKRFKQLDSSSTRKSGGAGLGLTIVKNLVQMQGGKIEVESQLNKGSVFKVCMKFAMPKEGEKAVDNKIPCFVAKRIHSLEGFKILVVEDNKLNQMLTEKILQKMGASVEIADSGNIAIEMLNNQKFDLVLMDLQMPDMDGYQTTAHIRNHMMNDVSNIPIVALTANAINGEKNRCLELGMNDYLSKPFQANQLYDIIAKILIEKNISYKPPMYNLSFLRKLNSGHNDFIKSILEQFLNQTPTLVSEINESLEKTDWERMAKATHKLKPSLEYIGAVELKEQVLQMETLIKTHKPENELSQLIKNLTESCNIIYMELEKELIKINTNN